MKISVTTPFIWLYTTILSSSSSSSSSLGDAIHCKIVDLGNSCFEGEQFTLNIQTRQYRCPETLLQMYYSFSADVWSAACVIYEMITGKYLFQPDGDTEALRDLDQLSRFEEVVGRIPKEMVEESPRRKELFKHDVRSVAR